MSTQTRCQEISVPKIALARTLSVSLAAIKARPLYCIVHRATEQQRKTLQELVAHARSSNLQSADELETLIPHLMEWHIAPISGEFLTRKAAVQNCAREIASGDWIATVHEYASDECRKVCAS